MEYLKRHWKSRTLILLLLGTSVSFAFWGLELTDWAAEVNAQPNSHGGHGEDRERPPAALMFVLPFVKCFVFMLLPASIVVATRAVFNRFARS